MSAIAEIPIGAIKEARQRISGIAYRTPLLPDRDHAELVLKLENLQPIGSFKLRGAANAMMSAPRESLAGGVVTASAGNMAQGVAWCARSLGVPCRVVVPEGAPANKIAAIRRLGGEVISAPFDKWWQAMLDHRYPGVDGVFIHPFADAAVMAGNGTIGLEILEDDPDVDAVLVPWGGGGLACGIATAVRAINPAVKVFAVEVEAAAPLAAAFARGGAGDIEPVRSFVDGIGGRSVAPEMWQLARELLAGVLIVTAADVAAAIKGLAERNRVVAEGAGGAGVAAALKGVPGVRRPAAIVSGGNIDPEKLAVILRGGVP
ncbi:MAG TPA: pyridoxal-phosphate dependent enzyme [Gemmatimonadales bacterium]